MFDESARSEPEPVTDSVPVEIVVVPLYVFAPERSRIPAPVFVRLPLPATMPPYESVWADAT